MGSGLGVLLYHLTLDELPEYKGEFLPKLIVAMVAAFIGLGSMSFVFLGLPRKSRRNDTPAS